MQCLRDLNIVSLDGVQRGSDIARVSGGVLGMVGSGAAIVGIALAPFTLGISTAVTVGGLALGAAGTATAVTAVGVRMLKEKHMRDAFVALSTQDLTSSAEIQRIVCDVNIVSEKIRLETERIVTSQSCVPGVNTSALLSSVRVARFLSVVAHVDSVAQVAAGAGRLATRAVGVVFAGLGIAVDAVDIGFASHSIYSGSKNEIAQALTESCLQLETQQRAFAELYQLLSMDC